MRRRTCACRFLCTRTAGAPIDKGALNHVHRSCAYQRAPNKGPSEMIFFFISTTGVPELFSWRCRFPQPNPKARGSLLTAWLIDNTPHIFVYHNTLACFVNKVRKTSEKDTFFFFYQPACRNNALHSTRAARTDKTQPTGLRVHHSVVEGNKKAKPITGERNATIKTTLFR